MLCYAEQSLALVLHVIYWYDRVHSYILYAIIYVMLRLSYVRLCFVRSS